MRSRTLALTLSITWWQIDTVILIGGEVRSKLPEISHRPMRHGQTSACHSRDYSQTGQAAVAHVVYSNAWSTSMTWPHHVTASSIISLGAHDITSTASQQLSQPSRCLSHSAPSKHCLSQEATSAGPPQNTLSVEDRHCAATPSQRRRAGPS